LACAASLYLGTSETYRDCTLEFAFGFQPIIQLIAWEAATVKVDSYARSLVSSRLGAWFAEVSFA